MKLNFGRKVFRQIFALEFWANFQPKKQNLLFFSFMAQKGLENAFLEAYICLF
jgi:hypothetical protein